MSTDTDLRANLADWRRHAVSAAITLIPMIIAAAVAWGLMTGRMEGVINTVNRNSTSIDSLFVRMNTMERQNAVVLQRLDDIKQSQDRLENKFDGARNR